VRRSSPAQRATSSQSGIHRKMGILPFWHTVFGAFGAIEVCSGIAHRSQRSGLGNQAVASEITELRPRLVRWPLSISGVDFAFRGRITRVMGGDPGRKKDLMEDSTFWRSISAWSTLGLRFAERRGDAVDEAARKAVIRKIGAILSDDPVRGDT